MYILARKDGHTYHFQITGGRLAYLNYDADEPAWMPYNEETYPDDTTMSWSKAVKTWVGIMNMLRADGYTDIYIID